MSRDNRFAVALAFFAAYLCFFAADAPARADVPETVLYSFGTTPDTGLSLAPNGTFYGSTYYNLFNISDDGSSFSILPYLNNPSIANDGSYPQGSILVTSDGSLYGVTAGGGANDGGIIYKVSPTGAYSILYSFLMGEPGNYQLGGLTLGADGLLYGTTAAYGGSASSLYSISTVGYGFTTRTVFDGGSRSYGDSGGTGPQNPIGTLTLGPGGVFYGVSLSGGTAGYGTIYTFTPDAAEIGGTVATLHSFNDGTIASDGYDPNCGVTLDAAGNAYGTTLGGGTAGDGCIYKLAANGTYTILHSFSGSDGQMCEAPPIVGSDGNLYGTTSRGGANGFGVAYSITPAGVYNVIYNFGGYQSINGDSPASQLVEDGSGNLLGTTQSGGSYNCGVIYKLQTSLPFTGALSGLTITPSSVVGGTNDNPAVGTVMLNAPNPTHATTVTLSYSDPSIAFVPATVTIPAGQTSATFPIYTNSVTSTATAIITATSATSVSATLSVTPPPPAFSSITLASQNLGGSSSSPGNSVNLNRDVSADTTILLSSTNPALATVPAGIVIKAGSSSQTFTITTKYTTTGGQFAVMVTMGNMGTSSTTIYVSPPYLKSVVLSPTSAQGGTVTTANRVYFNGNANSTSVVNLSSSNPAVAAVPSTATIQQGSSSHVFTITTKAVTSPQTVTITATCAGLTQTATLIVTPPPISLKSVILSPTSVEGGTSATASRVYLTGNAAATTTVSVSSSNPAVASVPSTVTIQQGYSSHTFSITTKPVTSPQTVTITATSGSVSQTATLTVTP